jgi:hypothetical protein
MIQRIIGMAVLTALIQMTARGADPSEGLIDFGKFTPPESGGQFVEVNIGSNLLSMAASLTQKVEPEMSDLIRGITSIRVNVIGLTKDNRAEMEERVKNVRGQLDTRGWERIVTAQQQGQDVAIYLKTRGEEAVEGLVVTVLQGNKEAVFINIVGNIRPEKLAIIGDRFNIDPLKKLGPAAEKKSQQKAG